MLVMQGILATFFSQGKLKVTCEAQAADILGATVFDKEAPSIFWRLGVSGIRPTIDYVANSSIAEQCGLSKGDIILEIGKEPVYRTTDVITHLPKSRSITVLRNKEMLSLSFEQSQNIDRDKIAKNSQINIPQTPTTQTTRPENRKTIATKPRIVINKRFFQDKLLNSEFQVLEKELGKLQNEFRMGEQDDYVVDKAFKSFASTNPSFEKLLGTWVEKYPASAIARTARGYYYSHLGWKFRGTDFIKNTRHEKLRSMEECFLKAVTDLTEACKIDPGLSVAVGELVKIVRSVGNTQASEALFSAGLQQNPSSFILMWAYLNSLQPKWGGSMEQIRHFLSSIDGQLDNESGLSAFRAYPDFVTADTLRLEENYQEAIAYYTKALDAGLPVNLDRGWAFSGLGSYEEAISEFSTVLKSDPQDVEALKYRGIAYSKMRNSEMAMKDYDAAIQLDPLEPEVLRYRAYELIAGGQAKNAMADLRASLKYDRYNYWNYYQMGELELNNFNNLKNAKKYFKKSVELAPQEPMITYNYMEFTYKTKGCDIELTYNQYQKACETSTSDYCNEERKQWIDRFYRYVKEDPKSGCKKSQH